MPKLARAPSLWCTAAVAALLLLMLAPVRAPAAELSLDADLSARIEHSDNVSLSLDERDSWRFSLSPFVSLRRSTDLSDIEGRAGLTFNEYTDGSVSDANDRFLSLSVRRTFARSRLGLRADYRRQTTLDRLSQTGLNVGRRTIDTYAMAPYWTRALSERLSLEAQLSGDQSRYVEREPGLTDETTLRGSIGLSYAFHPRLTTGLTLGFFDFDTSPFISRSKSVSLSANASYSVSERLRVSGSLGLQRVRTTQTQVVLVCPVDPLLCQLGLMQPVQVGSVGTEVRTAYPLSLSLTWAPSEIESVSFSAQQQISGSSVGVATGTSAINLDYSRALYPRLDFVVDAGLTWSHGLDGTRLGNFLRVGPSLRWRLTEAWGLEMGYIYRRSGYRDVDEHAQSNNVYLTLTYGWPLYRDAW